MNSPEKPLISFSGERIELHSPTALPAASAYLWNRNTLLNVNCRGFVSALHMQPEPARYSYGPNMEATTFAQPEQPYYAHHPGRFFYLKDTRSSELFSAPYEPVRRRPERFLFSAGPRDICWQLQFQGIGLEISLSLPEADSVERWHLRVSNHSAQSRDIALYPAFTLGYMSWMNQGAAYHPQLGAVIGKRVTPYQHLSDYPQVKAAKDLTFLLHDQTPNSWETRREVFEGEGGPHAPAAINADSLSNGTANYTTPIAALHYALTLAPGAQHEFRFLFGPAKDEAEISRIRQQYLPSRKGSDSECGGGHPLTTLQSQSPDQAFDHFLNTWLPRQVFYHADCNRFTTDPQTRNYLQDNMGAAYLAPSLARAAFITALSQQENSGALPDGILLNDQATLKYINQVPHSDHCLWLPLCLEAYLDESDDYALLGEAVPSRGNTNEKTSVYQRVCAALDYLWGRRDQRGLVYIEQGDWCDPMNMVGPAGIGVSGWLSIALVHALQVWAQICRCHGDSDSAERYAAYAAELAAVCNDTLWDGQWYARGITDGGRRFGTQADTEGRIYLNPQSWALLARIADDAQTEALLSAVDRELGTPWGLAMLAPAYTAMQEDIGRITQKFPGSAENGSIYNHAAMFFIHALYKIGRHDQAFHWLRTMLPGPDVDDLLRRGQLPNFLPNYYRGAWRQFPEEAGRSSGLFNTGTAAWYYRVVIEQLYGLRGCREGLRLQPGLPSHWQSASVTRRFRGAILNITYQREAHCSEPRYAVDGQALPTPLITNITPRQTCQVIITLPSEEPSP